MMETNYLYRWHDVPEKADSPDAEWCGVVDRLSAYVWAGLFLWAGTSLVLDATGVYVSVGVDGWVAFFLGVSAILITEIVIRWVSPTIHRPELITYLGLGGALGIALGAFWVVFAAIMVVIGVSILVDAVRVTDSRSTSGPIS